MTNDELLALGAMAGIGALLVAVSRDASLPQPSVMAGLPEFENELHDYDEFGKIDWFGKKKRKAIKRCKPIGGKSASDYSYRRDPKMWCHLAKSRIETGMEAGELLRTLRHGKQPGAKVVQHSLGPIVRVVDELRQLPLKQQKKRYNKRCVPCGYKPMRYGTWISTSKHSYSKLMPKKLRFARWKRNVKRRKLKKFKNMG